MKCNWTKTLYLYRGLPGSGKSTLALEKVKGQRKRFVENDDFWRLDRELYIYDPEMTHIAGWWCWAEAFRRLQIYDEVAVANVFAKKQTILGWIEEAQKHEINIIIVNVGMNLKPDECLSRCKNGISLGAFMKMLKDFETFSKEEILNYENNHVQIIDQ